jgi:replicative DNA helicase
MAAAQIGREAAQISDWIPDGTLEDERVLRAIAKRRPQLHHLREGGGEREADLVIGLLSYRADYLAAAEQAGMDKLVIETGSAGPFDVGVIKNRYGQLGLATLVLESRTGFIRDAGVFGR